jgi:hypothetical protein
MMEAAEFALCPGNSSSKVKDYINKRKNGFTERSDYMAGYLRLLII